LGNSDGYPIFSVRNPQRLLRASFNALTATLGQRALALQCLHRSIEDTLGVMKIGVFQSEFRNVLL